MLRPSLTLLASLCAASTLLVDSKPIQRDVGKTFGIYESSVSAAEPRNTVLEQRGEVQAHWDYARCPAPGDSPGPRLTPDTPENFRGNSWLAIAFGQTPSTAAPAGFSRAYIGADGIPYGKDAGLMMATIPLDSYDVGMCKKYCDDYDCQSFSTFMGRTTQVDMAKVDLNVCNNPPSQTTFNCALYSKSIAKALVNHHGMVLGNYFQTAIAAANGYVRSEIYRDLAGYSGVTYPGGTTSNGYTSQFLLAVYNFNDEHTLAIGYTPEACAAKCDANKECVGFDVSQTLADGAFAGTQCLLYKTVISIDQANNPGQWSNENKWMSFQPSVFYSKASEPVAAAPVTLKNAGFEDATTMAPWAVESELALVVDTVSLTGSRSMALGYVGAVGSMAYGEEILATADRNYTISFWLTNAATCAPPYVAEFNVIWNGATVYSNTDNEARGWQHIEVPVTAKAKNTLSFTSRQDVSYLLIDDVAITAAK